MLDNRPSLGNRMNTGRSALTIFACVCLLVFTERIVMQASGAGLKEQVSLAGSAKQTKGSPREVQRPAMPQKQAFSTPVTPKTPGKKGHRPLKVQKKAAPKAVVQPRTDLMYYGVLEDAQRYDPRPSSPAGALFNPQTPDLTHDHFQELDRNQDGMIDPVERALGRIDMDRDLHTRTLQ